MFSPSTRVRLAGIGLGLLALAVPFAQLAQVNPADAAPTQPRPLAAGFVRVHGTAVHDHYTNLAMTGNSATTRGMPIPVLVTHQNIGEYSVVLRSTRIGSPMTERLDNEGVAFAQPLGEPDGVTCHPQTSWITATGDISFRVYCLTAERAYIDHAFAATYTNGGAGEEGTVAIARLGLTLHDAVPYVPAVQYSSLPGSDDQDTVVVRTAKGAYRVTMRVPPRPEDVVQVSSLWEGACQVAQRFAQKAEGPMFIDVTCTDRNGPVDTQFAVAYASGASVLGSLYDFSDAHALVDPFAELSSTGPAIFIQRTRFGATAAGAFGFQRLGAGSYLVTADRQNLGPRPGVAQVTALGAGAAVCQPVTDLPFQQEDRQVLVSCLANGYPADSRFFFQYVTEQP